MLKQGEQVAYLDLRGPGVAYWATKQCKGVRVDYMPGYGSFSIGCNVENIVIEGKVYQ